MLLYLLSHHGGVHCSVILIFWNSNVFSFFFFLNKSLVNQEHHIMQDLHREVKLTLITFYYYAISRFNRNVRMRTYAAPLAFSPQGCSLILIFWNSNVFS
jgi:hypothetical protein